MVVEFDTEVDVTYNYYIEKEARVGKVKLALFRVKKLGSYEEIHQIGAVVEMKWTKDDLANTEWPAGMCVYFVLYDLYSKLNDNQLELNSSCLELFRQLTLSPKKMLDLIGIQTYVPL